ncbi:MAG: gfo/Idh/MocA family oxidoreductase [Chitinivibrionales bacterium]|nr:gfo/Idh/MocA family oxidoreductase [Chitinivibrionales bacterium]
MLKIGVVGYGYWGPNIVRNFNALDDSEVAFVCDQNPEVLKKVSKLYPNIECLTSCEEALASNSIDALAIVTPVSTHYPLAKKALEQGKHVFVEKPFTVTTAQADELCNLAERKNLVIMVDHTFLFTGAVRKIKDIVDKDELGSVLYYDSTRVNLGLFQHDVNVVWDLAPHDFSIMNYVLKDKPTGIVATGKAHVGEFENIAYITVYFDNNLIAHFAVNWLSPVKVRNTLIGGERKMLVWNDVDPDEKIKIYDKGIDVTSKEGIYKLLVSYRSGDMYAPRVDPMEALKLEANYFVDCVEKSEKPFNSGIEGMQVVQMLEACNESIKAGGKVVKLD